MATVLLVEDDPDTREVEYTVLSMTGHEVLLAANGRDAIAELEKRRPCVILLDLMMPVMDGLTFLAERQRRGLAPGVPVVCVSAAGEHLVREAISLGAAECLHKPADIDALCDCVDRYCRA